MIIKEEFNVSPLFINGRTAAFSLDLEYDYGGDGVDALKRFEDLVVWLADKKVDLTVFVEGRVLKEHSTLIDLLNQPHIYPALHCLDHRQSKDTRVDIERGMDLFHKRLGTHPKGYRAHTFQFSRALVRDLIDLGFEWDSSYLPSWLGYGASRDSRLSNTLKSGADAICFQDTEAGRTLIELPVGTLKGINVPFIHSYQLLVGNIISSCVQRLFNIQKLHIHDAHMVDLYKATTSLSDGAIPQMARWLYRLSWMGRQDNSLAILDAFICRGETLGWSWCSIDDICKRLKSHDY